MSYAGAMRALAEHALGHVEDYDIVGLGSGRAATALVRALGRMTRSGEIDIVGVPTSLQIKRVAEEYGMPLVEPDQVDRIDVVFDGADQVDASKYLVKGGGGALLRENILFGLARKVVVMADETKFARVLDRPVPVEVHPAARTHAAARLESMGCSAALRAGARGYPFFTESGNLVLDCDFGPIRRPGPLAARIRQVAGVAEAGIFTRRPDVVYRARKGSKFDVI